MNKYILVITIILLSFSCKHNNAYNPYSVVIPIDGEIYYYKSCKTTEVEYICKFKCKEDTDISKLRDQNINYECSILEGALPHSEMGEIFNTNIINNIVSPIRNYNTLNILPVDYDEFLEFDTIFSKYGIKSNETNRACTSWQCAELSGILMNVWKKYKKDSITIYQNRTYKDLGSIQWVMLYKQDNNGKIFPLDLTYDEARKTCEEYEFENFKKWSLPTNEHLTEAIKLGLGNELNRNIKFDNFKNAFVWDLKGEAYGLMRISETIEPKKDLPDNPKLYVICSRYMDLKEVAW